ncbi:forkhead-associated domain-containing protein 1 [Latimeria chalumnae]|uniref:forkhead-associated domain-containing protein 1 n=1 Tax=Latimeria chalumnae TaxID=7897 RepID=UPI00313DAAAA
MKGFLKSSESVFALRPKTTTVGKLEESDLCLLSGGIEDQHAVIEFSDTENCFVLQDLNSLHGSFVNECRIQNAAVRLAAGDVLRFGYGGETYELVVGNTPQITYPSVTQRLVWPGQLQLIEESKSPTAPVVLSQLPYIQCQPSTNSPSGWIQGGNGTVPHPPIRTRPVSAGSRRTTPNIAADTMSGPPVIRQGGWINTPGGLRSVVNGVPPATSPTLELLLQEKDLRLLRMGDEVSRLLVFESESKRKDTVIAGLHDEIAALKHQIAQTGPSQGDIQITQKLLALERDIRTKKNEIQALKEQITKLQKGSSEVIRHSLNERDLEITNLKNELEKQKKDNNMTSGLVTSLQRDISAKEQQVLRLNSEVDKLKKVNREKDSQLAAVSVKFSKMRETKKHEEELIAKDKELLTYKQGLKQMKLKVKELEEEIQRHHTEQKKMKTGQTEERQIQEQRKEEIERNKLQLQEMGHRERLIKMELEKMRTRVRTERIKLELELFRSHIIQATYSALEVATPEEAVTDQQVIEGIKQLFEERMQFQEKVKVFEDELSVKSTEQADVFINHEELKKTLEECQACLKKAFSSSVLQKEIDTLKDLCVDQQVQWFQSATVEILTTTLLWQQQVEQALQDAGIDMSSSDEGQLTDFSHTQLDELQGSQNTLLQEKLVEMKEENEKQLQEEMKKIQAAAEEQNRQYLEDAVAHEKDKMQQMIMEERKKVEELEARFGKLTEDLEEKSKEEETLKSRLNELAEKLDRARKTETKLREELVVGEERRKVEIQAVQERNKEEKRSHQEELAEYKEQIRQHSRTIVALEDRLLKVSKQQQKLKETNAALQEKLRGDEREQKKKEPAEAPSQILPPPDPPELYVLEQAGIALRRELGEAQREILSQQEVIAGLKRDLAGANARMSDMKGELSEEQKTELEQNQALVRDQKQELNTLGHQLANMSQLVDRKNIELKTVSEDLRHAKEKAEKQNNILKEKEAQLEKLQQEVKSEQGSSCQQNEPAKHNEEMLSFDLAELGAKCKGHRHDEVIQRQKEALAELRTRLKALEQIRPPMSTQDQALQQVSVLKKELAEMRAQQAVLDNKHLKSSGQNTTETKMSQSRLSSSMSDVAIERTARLEMSETLDLSERTYLDLIHVLSNLLRIPELSGSLSLKHIPQDERQKVATQRQGDLELLSSRVTQLRSQLERKEELLTGYEKDLEQLRQSQTRAHKCQSEIDRLEEEFQKQIEENLMLREALDRVQFRLDQEKRLNKAIKQRKIETLKRQLQDQDQELCTTTTKLINLQNAVRLENLAVYRFIKIDLTRG